MSFPIRVVWLFVCAASLCMGAQPDFSAIRMGAWFETTRQSVEKDRLADTDKAALENFRRWYASTGRPLAEKSLAGIALAEDESAWEWIARAGYMYEAFDNGSPKHNEGEPDGPAKYMQSALVAGQEVMRKGYAGAKLTAEEMGRLRDYRLYTEMKRTQAAVLPHQFKFSGRAPEVGDEAPDFCLPLLETVLARPAYTDENPQNKLAFLMPEGLDRFTRIFPGYQEMNGRIEAKPFAVRGRDEGYVQLSTYRGKKPVLLILANSSDVFLRAGLPGLEPLVQAYKDRVEFMLVEISYHDSFSGGIEFYGPEAGRQTIHLWTSIPEERARLAKLQYMRNPNVTLNCVMDDVHQTTRTKYHAEGGAMEYYLVGLDGKIASKNPGGWFYWDGGNYPDTVLWLNEVERDIQALLAGIPDESPPANKARLAVRPAFTGRKAKNYGGEIKNTVWFSGTVTSVDLEKKTVQVTASTPDENAMKGWNFIRQDHARIKIHAEVQGNLNTVEKWIWDGLDEKICTFQLGDDVELFLNGREAEPDDFRPGDKVGAKFLPANETGRLIRPEHFRASRIGKHEK